MGYIADHTSVASVLCEIPFDIEDGANTTEHTPHR